MVARNKSPGMRFRQRAQAIHFPCEGSLDTEPLGPVGCTFGAIFFGVRNVRRLRAFPVAYDPLPPRI